MIRHAVESQGSAVNECLLQHALEGWMLAIGMCFPVPVARMARDFHLLLKQGFFAAERRGA